MSQTSFGQDRRVVLTLDAGGTSFRFYAVRGGRAFLGPIQFPSYGHDLDACLNQLLTGFESVYQAAGHEAVALSLAFPGPADYEAGVIGDLPNLTAFRGGVAIGPLLAKRFGLPAFLNNDGALFAYGEAIGGLLPWVNDRLAAAGNALRFRNLLGFTFGTGFGGGLVIDRRLVRGDNSAAGQIWKMRHRDERRCFVEEGVSIRAVRRVYAAMARIPFEKAPEPKTIAAIASGEAAGDAPAARESFRQFGRIAGDAIAQALTLIDGLVVLGGGLSAAASLFMPALLEEMNDQLEWTDGTPIDRLALKVLDLESPSGVETLVRTGTKAVPIYGLAETAPYQSEKRTGIGITRLGTSQAITLGAYAYALEQIGD